MVEAPPGQPAGTNHPNPFYADHHWLPIHCCTMKRSFYNPQEGLNSEADSPLQGSSLQAFQYFRRFAQACADARAILCNLKISMLDIPLRLVVMR